MDIKTITTGELHNDTYILTNQNNESIIIDAAAPLNQIIAETQNKKVLALFLTHGHYDHIENLDEIMNYFPQIKGFIHKNEIDKLYTPELNYSHVFGTIKVCSTPKDRFILLEDKEDLLISDFKIKTILTKGHTNGSICLEINGKLFTGDTLLHYTCGRTDLLTGSEEDMQKSLKYLSKNYRGWDYYSGHGKKGKVM